MSTLYNEYLTGDDREIAIVEAQTDAQLSRLNLLLETTASTLQSNLLMAEAKVFAESGTYDDLEMLYAEAYKDANAKNENIFQKIWGVIKGFFKRIGDWFAEKFGKTEIPNPVKVDSSFEKKMGLFRKACETCKSAINDFANGNITDGLKNLGKVVAPLLAAIAGVAFTGKMIEKNKETIQGWVDELKSKHEWLNNAIDKAEKFFSKKGSNNAGQQANADANATADNAQKNGAVAKAGANGVATTNKEFNSVGDVLKDPIGAIKKLGSEVWGLMKSLWSMITNSKGSDDDVADEQIPNRTSDNVHHTPRKEPTGKRLDTVRSMWAKHIGKGMGKKGGWTDQDTEDAKRAYLNREAPFDKKMKFESVEDIDALYRMFLEGGLFTENDSIDADELFDICFESVSNYVASKGVQSTETDSDDTVDDLLTESDMDMDSDDYAELCALFAEL